MKNKKDRYSKGENLFHMPSETRQSTRDKTRLFQVVELQKRRHFDSTESCEGREETRVMKNGSKESVRD